MDYPFIITAGTDNIVTGLLILDESCMGCVSTKAGETAYRSPTLAKAGETLPTEAVPL